jgi:hypothetical protein
MLGSQPVVETRCTYCGLIAKDRLKGDTCRVCFRGRMIMVKLFKNKDVTTLSVSPQNPRL